MEHKLSTYEPPMLAEAGDFAELTQGSIGLCTDEPCNGRQISSGSELEWIFV